MGNGPEGKAPAGKKSRLKTAVQTRGDRAFNHSSSNGDGSRGMNGRENFWKGKEVKDSSKIFQL